MQGLKEDGLISCYQDYIDLPLAVLSDWRMYAVARAAKHQREANRTERRRGARGVR